MKTHCQGTQKNYIEQYNLSIFQRVLLKTDGTVTDILEAYAFEKIYAIKLQEEKVYLDTDITLMNLIKGSEIITRKVLLQGEKSRKNFVYAESVLVPDRLDTLFKYVLLKTSTPIGRIWSEQQVETFKEILEMRRERAGDISVHFGIAPSDYLLSRTYKVMTQRKAVMMITEKFPEQSFLGNV